MVARRADLHIDHSAFSRLGSHLQAGDVVVVNTSATLPAAVAAVDGLLVHLSTELADGRWVVELRRPCGAASLPSARGSSVSASS